MAVFPSGLEACHVRRALSGRADYRGIVRRRRSVMVGWGLPKGQAPSADPDRRAQPRIMRARRATAASTMEPSRRGCDACRVERHQHGGCPAELVDRGCEDRRDHPAPATDGSRRVPASPDGHPVRHHSASPSISRGTPASSAVAALAPAEQHDPRADPVERHPPSILNSTDRPASPSDRLTTAGRRTMDSAQSTSAANPTIACTRRTAINSSSAADSTLTSLPSLRPPAVQHACDTPGEHGLSARHPRAPARRVGD